MKRVPSDWKTYQIVYETKTGPVFTVTKKAKSKESIIDFHNTLPDPWPIVSIKEVK